MVEALPVDVLDHVLTFTVTCPRDWIRLVVTCKNWRNVLQSSRHVHFTISTPRVPLSAYITYVPRIRELNLTDNKYIDDCSVLYLLTHLEHVYALTLSASTNNYNISDDCMWSIVHVTPSMRRLDISNCERITDTGVGALLVHLPQLESLNLSGCYRITASVFDITTTTTSVNKRLRWLDLSGCYDVSDETMCALTLCFPSLHTLIVSNCPRVTDNGVANVRKRLNNLQTFEFFYCNTQTK